MNKEALKKTLRPLIKECIKEVIFEEGVLSGIISEVVKGTGVQQIVETQQPTYQAPQVNYEAKQRKLQEQRKQMLDSIGREAFNGVDVFEGTKPLKKGGTQGQGKSSGGYNPFDGVDPNNPGVNIDKLTSNLGNVWKKLAEGKK